MSRKITTLVPVILAGGAGTRLWPVSRELFPKQFVKFSDSYSLLQQTVLRAKKISISVKPLIICNEANYFLCIDHLAEIGIEADFILEPERKNTAPAIAAAAMWVADTYGKDVNLLILPSDHHIQEETLFAQIVQDSASQLGTDGHLVTFGITPTSPETGFGYIESGSPAFNDNKAFKVTRFVEKPCLSKAQTFLEQGNFYWNSGMFLFGASTYLNALKHHEPEIYQCSYLALQRAVVKNDVVRLDRKSFSECKSESIDYAVMEKTDKAIVVPMPVTWSDLGSWQSILETKGDQHDNITTGNVVASDTNNCLLRSDGQMIVAKGLENTVVVSTKDAVLVAHKNHAQDLKQLVNQIKEKHHDMAISHTLVHRPWGQYEVLLKGDKFQVKKITIKPGESISLQLHNFRTEHWVVIEGIAEVVCGENIQTLYPNESTYIPVKTKHRLSNQQDKPLSIIEVQLGDYLGEDDIVRFEDKYERIEEQ